MAPEAVDGVPVAGPVGKPDGARCVAGGSLRVCILAHASYSAGAASVGRGLIEGLAATAPECTYFVTIPEAYGYGASCARLPKATVLVYRRHGFRWAWEVFGLPRAVRSFRPDVILDLGGRGFIRPPCPQAILLQRPHWFYPSRHYGRDTLRHRLLQAYHRCHFRRALRRTGLLLCQTPVAAKRVVDAYGFAGRVSICPNAVSAMTIAGESEADVPAPLRPHEGRYKLLCVSTYYPHKNLEAIVDLFARYRADVGGAIAVLTLSAEKGSGAARLVRTIRRRGLAESILCVGYVEQARLAGYYRHCQALLFPTLLESFSGTYLEAMRYGLPILTSDLDFAHGVCGDAAEYFDPWDTASIRDAVVRLRRDPERARQLAERGRRRMAETYGSWESVAGRLFAELVELAGRS